MAGRFVLVATAFIALVAFSGTPDRAFVTSAACLSCHNGVVSPSGEDLSFGLAWSTGMMANAARDPYWQAGVRRETMDHPTAAAAIQNECSRCHMPMANIVQRGRGDVAGVFEHLPIVGASSDEANLAADGVSCALCHGIGPDGAGTEESFTGGFEPVPGVAFGPHEIDAGRSRVMASSSGVQPNMSGHLGKSAFCASCHTLITHSLDETGAVVGEFPEQVPYLEWRHSAWQEEASCQDCHMPEVKEEAPITSVLGQPRPGVSRHTFQGGNAFMQALLGANALELGVTQTPSAMQAAAARTDDHLATAAADVSLVASRTDDGELGIRVIVTNRTGHKLPTAYPSRRVWIELDVRDAEGRSVFSSGRPLSNGSIAGNDNDSDGGAFESHRTEIRSADEVQIYEAVLGEPGGSVTTGLLRATTYLKDNRLLPRGFDPQTAGEWIAVQGEAASDPDFTEASDVVRYLVDVPVVSAGYSVRATLWYQSVGYRWAANLAAYDAMETQRFVRMYRAMESRSPKRLAEARIDVDE